MSGHGHVYPNPGGFLARCGGPGLCPECRDDLARAQQEVKTKLMAEEILTATGVLVRLERERVSPNIEKIPEIETLTHEQLARVSQEYHEIMSEIVSSIVPIHAQNAAGSHYAIGAIDAQTRIMKAIQPILLRSAIRYGKMVIESTERRHLRGACLELSDALAKRCLADANEECAGTGEWPGGQSWDDLAGTSQSIMRHRAWDEAELWRDAMIHLLFDRDGYPKEYEAEALKIPDPINLESAPPATTEDVPY